MRPASALMPIVLAAITLLPWPVAAQEVARVLPPGHLPQDKRVGPQKDLDGYFPFTPPKTKEEWTARAELVRRRVLLAAGLWPMPEKTPDHAVVHGLVDRDGYTVEKVFFESYPGLFVTGNLYRPKGRTGRLPGVLCPHGHWPNGRFYDAGAKPIRQSIVEGAERFEVGGRCPVQARCVQLARMGCVVFHYDMIGYADSIQLPHRPNPGAKKDMPEEGGFFTAAAEARLVSIFGLQTYDSVRALDWLLAREDVDPHRIGVTGCSGGGTQTFILTAIDSRVTVPFPAVMVSTAMQGGCTCENACCLRVGTGNIEFAALAAPRPLGMTAADDWTKEIATKGMPELKQLYRMLGVESLVMAKPLLQFPHNYNYVSREVMYHWFNKHLKLGLPEPIVEEDFKPLSIADMSVWDDAHPKPASGRPFERSLVTEIAAASDRQIQALVPHDAASLAAYRRVVGGAAEVLLGRGVPAAGVIQASRQEPVDRGTFRMTKMLLRHASEGEELPAILLEGKTPSKQVVVWVSREGKQAMFDAAGSPQEPIRKLLAAGATVLGIDMIGQGEFTADGRPLAKSRLNHKQQLWTISASYTYGYNDPVVVRRVHDILSAVSFARHGLSARKVHLAGLQGAGHWVLLARAQAGAAVDRAVADTAGFRFARLTAYDEPDFLPGAVKYLDLPGLAALGTPHPLWLDGEGAQPPLVTDAYRAAGAEKSLAVSTGDPSTRAAAAVEWLLQ